ncbi:MAG: AMP-binding enzyme [Candidatus Promineifilaceae bacterium]
MLEKGHSVGEDELHDFCRERLARYKVPKEFVFVDALPYSPYGKVMKQQLKKQFGS